MPRQWTEEQKQAARERLAAARAKKAEKNAQPVENSPNVSDPITTATGEQDMATILKQALEAIATLASLKGESPQAGTNINAAGKMTGTVERFAIDPINYPDPTKRLADEPRLQRFGFKENYELKYTVTTSEYTTIDNIRMREPKFILDLIRVVYDEETGEATPGRYIEYRMVLHEDPDTALHIARSSGLPIDEGNEKDFLNEMRYLRMRDWLLECFYKPKPTSNRNRREMVINNKLVEYFEISSENSSSIPFNQLDSKL